MLEIICRLLYCKKMITFKTLPIQILSTPVKGFEYILEEQTGMETFIYNNKELTCCVMPEINQDIHQTPIPGLAIISPGLYAAIKNRALKAFNLLEQQLFTLDLNYKDIKDSVLTIPELNITILRRDIASFFKAFTSVNKNMPSNFTDIIGFYKNKAAYFNENEVTFNTALDLIGIYLPNNIVHKSYFKEVIATPSDIDSQTDNLIKVLTDLRDLSKGKGGVVNLGLGKNKMICIASCEKDKESFYILSVSGIVDKNFPGCLERLSKLVKEYNKNNPIPIYIAPLYNQDISESLLYSKRGLIPEEIDLKELLLEDDKKAGTTDISLLKAIEKEGRNLKNTSGFNGTYCEEVSQTGHFEARKNTSCSESAFLLAKTLFFPKTTVKKMLMIHAKSVVNEKDLKPLCQDMCGNCKTFIDKDLTLTSIAEVIKPKKHFKKFNLYKDYSKKFETLNNITSK